MDDHRKLYKSSQTISFQSPSSDRYDGSDDRRVSEERSEGRKPLTPGGSKKSGIPDKKMRLFMDHAQRTVDVTKMVSQTMSPADLNHSFTAKETTAGNRSQTPIYSHFSLQGVSVDSQEDTVLPKDSSQPPPSAEPKLSTVPNVPTGSAPPPLVPSASPSTPQRPPDPQSPVSEPSLPADSQPTPHANSRSSRLSIGSEKDTERAQRSFNPSSQPRTLMESIIDSDSIIEDDDTMNHNNENMNMNNNMSNMNNMNMNNNMNNMNNMNTMNTMNTMNSMNNMNTNNMSSNKQSSSAASVPLKIPSRPSSRRGFAPPRTSSMDSTMTTDSMIINPGRPQETNLPVEREEPVPEPQYQSDVEQFIQSVSGGIQRLQNEYTKKYTECSEFLKNDRVMANVIERIDASDSEMRMKLNKKLERKFDKDVSQKTFEIKEQIRYCNDEIEVLSERKANQTSDAFLSYVFSLTIEGFSALGYFPLMFLSFIKRVLMIPMDDGETDTINTNPSGKPLHRRSHSSVIDDSSD